MTKASRRLARRQAARPRDLEASADQRPWWRRVLARAWAWFFGQLGPGRQRFLVRVMVAWHRYWTNPAVPPEQLGRAGRHEYRPAKIELGFLLYANGDVVFRNRWGNDEIVTDEHLIGLVHREYRRLVEEGRRQSASQR